VRLRESRKSDSFDDQKSPAQILTAENAAITHQDFLDYLLSQLRQILGTAKWSHAVPESLESLSRKLHFQHVFPANCLPTDMVGDCVYVRENPIDGFFQVTKGDPLSLSKMPIVGIIKEKSTTTICDVQFSGVFEGIYGGMMAGRSVFVGLDGELTHIPPAPPLGGFVFWQVVGSALGDEEIILTPGVSMIQKIG
jgi:hypothetical protein